MKGVFISGVGTGVGKTYVSRATSSALKLRGIQVGAMKPIETGCQPNPSDALALSKAAGCDALANYPGFYRSPLALAPYSVALHNKEPFIDVNALYTSVRQASSKYQYSLIEGAGGVLAPIAPGITNVDFAKALGHPLVIVAQDSLGVLSYVISAVESCLRRDLPPACIVLSRHNRPEYTDISAETNQRVLTDWLGLPVFMLQHIIDDSVLGFQAEQCGLVDFLLGFE